MIRCIIFDCDGLLIDTEVPAYESWQELYREYGLELPLELWAACLGASGDEFDPCLHLQDQLGRQLDCAKITAARWARKMEMVGNMGLMPGVADYIASGQRLGLSLGVASSSGCDWVLGHLRRLQIEDRFQSVKCADHVERVKPSPDLYQAVLSDFSLPPREVVVFEDSPNGITAARAAGIFCVAVPNRLTVQLPVGHAEMQVHSLEEMPLERLLQEVEARQSAVSGEAAS